VNASTQIAPIGSMRGGRAEQSSAQTV